MAREGLRVREVSEVEGNRLLRIVRRSSGSVVTWRRAQMVLLSVQGMAVAGIAKVTFISADWLWEVINNFNADGFDARYPKYAGGRPPVFSLPQRREIKKVALSRPGDHGLPFSTWSLSKLARFLVAEGVVDDISPEGLRVLLRNEEVSFQAVKTRKASTDLDFEAKKNWVVELYDIAEGMATPGPGDPTVVFSMDELGPLNLQPRPGRQWAPVVRRNKKSTPDAPRRRRQRATYTRTLGVQRLYRALDMNRDRLYRHMKTTKNRTKFLEFCRYLRSLYPPEARIAIVMDNYGSHLSTKNDTRVGAWAEANNLELASAPTNASILNRIERHFTAVRYVARNGIDHRSHGEQNSMIRRYIAWRNRHTDDEALCTVSKHAKVA